VENLQIDLNRLGKWAIENATVINPDKSMAVCFTRARVQVQVQVTLRLTVSQSVCLGVEPRPGLMTRYSLLFDSFCLVLGRAPSLTRGWVCLLSESI
jgi:hypothetical protein